jgi:hypothetical protein
MDCTFFLKMRTNESSQMIELILTLSLNKFNI